MKGAGEQQSGSPITDAALPALLYGAKACFQISDDARERSLQPKFPSPPPRHKAEQQQPGGQSTVYNSAICLYLFF